jgi:chromosome partitioning protein
MHVVCLVSLKGGAGKSTVVQSLAVCASQHDQQTLIVELDPQGSLKNWSKRRQADQPEVYQTLPQSLPEVLDDARQRGVRWVFVDTPGHESAAARAAMAAADLILIPCKIQSMKDFDAALLTINDAQQADKPAYVVMSQVPPNAQKLVRKRQLQMQERYNIAVLSRYLSRRADFEYCDERGLSAAELNPKGVAAEEISRLYDLLLSIFIVEGSRNQVEITVERVVDNQVPEAPEVVEPLEAQITVSEAGVVIVSEEDAAADAVEKEPETATDVTGEQQAEERSAQDNEREKEQKSASERENSLARLNYLG